MAAGVRRGDPSGLCDSLRQSPLLAVLRPGSPAQAQRQIDAVAAAGFHHVELAWSQEPWWLELLQALPNQWPELRFGVAGVRFAEQLVVAHAQGLRFAMSPISCPLMWEQADALDLTLVPGVFSPRSTRACTRGAVKLFPAASLGPSYWRRLRGPMARCRFVLQLVVFALQISVPGLPWGDAGSDPRFDPQDLAWAMPRAAVLAGITTNQETL